MYLNISLELEKQKFFQLIIAMFQQTNVYYILDNKYLERLSRKLFTITQFLFIILSSDKN